MTLEAMDKWKLARRGRQGLAAAAARAADLDPDRRRSGAGARAADAWRLQGSRRHAGDGLYPDEPRLAARHPSPPARAQGEAGLVSMDEREAAIASWLAQLDERERQANAGLLRDPGSDLNRSSTWRCAGASRLTR